MVDAMTRKFSIDFKHDGTCNVTAETDVDYQTVERGIEVLVGMINTVLPRYESVKIAVLNPKKPEPPVEVKPVDELKPVEITRLDKTLAAIEKQVKTTKRKEVAGVKTTGRKYKRQNKGNKYGIPSLLWKTDKKRYQILWSRCKKHGIMYEEAVKRDGMKGGGRPPSPKKVLAKSKEIIQKTVNPVHEPMILNSSPPLEIKIGTHVRQIKPFHDRQIKDKIGIVSGIKNGLIEVNFNGTQWYKIAPDCLEVV